MSIYSLFILFCLCMLPTDARRLPTIIHYKHLFPIKVEDKVKVVLMHSTQQRRSTNEQLDVSNTAKPKKKLKAETSKEEHSGKEDAVGEIVESSSVVVVGFLKATKTEGSNGGKEEEENHSANNKGIAETDYEPPHRKTPIHN